MFYHLFRKSVASAGGKKSRWYYWFRSEGKRFQRACPPSCDTEDEARRFIDSLPVPDGSARIRDIVRDMYVPGSTHYSRIVQYGRELSEETLLEKRRYLELISSLWGDLHLSELSSKTVAEYLLLQNRSGSWKNHFITAFRAVYEEAHWNGSSVPVPDLKRFSNNYHKADIMTTEELGRFFQEKNFPSRCMFLLFLSAVSGGLRIGEALALRRDSLVPAKNALVIDGFLKRRSGVRTAYCKTGTVESPKLRVTIIPSQVMSLLVSYADETDCRKDTDYLFRMDGRPVWERYAEDVFTDGLVRAGIEKNGRKLTCHSLRYIYITRMRRFLDGDTVRLMAGHSSIEMTEYYTRAEIDESVRALQTAVPSVSRLFE